MGGGVGIAGHASHRVVTERVRRRHARMRDRPRPRCRRPRCFWRSAGPARRIPRPHRPPHGGRRRDPCGLCRHFRAGGAPAGARRGGWRRRAIPPRSPTLPRPRRKASSPRGSRRSTGCFPAPMPAPSCAARGRWRATLPAKAAADVRKGSPLSVAATLALVRAVRAEPASRPRSPRIPLHLSRPGARRLRRGHPGGGDRQGPLAALAGGAGGGPGAGAPAAVLAPLGDDELAFARA